MAPTRRVTLREAADILGVSKEAVRKRVIRGTLPSETGEDGRRYVYLEAGGDEVATHEGAALISEMRDRITFLERELERKDAILLNMTEAMKAINPPAQGTPQEPPEAPETAREGEDRGTVSPEAQGGTSRRSWWRRLWGYPPEPGE
jgi:hypothetical protein